MVEYDAEEVVVIFYTSSIDPKLHIQSLPNDVVMVGFNVRF